MILKNSKGINKMKRRISAFCIFILAVSLSSCGGGGSGSVGGTPVTPPPNGFVIVMTPLVSSMPANTLGYPIFFGSPFLTQLDVKVSFPNGQIAPDGTIVNLTTNNANVGFLSVPDDPETEDINEFSSGWITQFDETVGGVATFFLHSGSTPGNVTYTAAASIEGRSYSSNLVFTISEGPNSSIQQLSANGYRDTLPVNELNTPFFNGIPFMTEVDIQYKDVFGNFTNPIGGVVNISVNPVSVLYFTTSPESDVRLNQGTIAMNSGHGSLFLWSKNVSGTAAITMTAIDPFGGFELDETFNIEVVDATDGNPTDVSLNNGAALYVNGSGGVTSTNAVVTVTSGNLPVSDPQLNNVRLTIITDSANSGEMLTGNNVNGNSVQGTTINVATVNGIVNALVNSGTDTNLITLTATVDRADNNVDNGIQDAITSVTNFIVSDGVLWALELTGPTLDALTVNAEFDDQGEITFQDGTYSLVISASATDKGGNPALPQTLQFGMINSPISGYPLEGHGEFIIAGFDGDPQEGGSNFTSLGGAFITAAQGVQINDTLLVFGEESVGNEDLESAVRVSSINSETSLTIFEKFNRNDETGSINNDFGVLPYAIGRAVDGNITATAVINDIGVATTRLNYPVSQLGRLNAIFVKGQGRIINGVVKSVTDVELGTFPGVEGFNSQSSTLIVSPNLIPGNTGGILFEVCVADSARNPLSGQEIVFAYVGEQGQGTIDGQSGTGSMIQHTGDNGCAIGIASTTGILPGNSDDLGFNFFAGSITCDLSDLDQDVCMKVIAPANGVLNANPSAFVDRRGPVTIILTLYDGSGNPIESASISGSCEQIDGGGLSIVSGPSVTDANGHSTVAVDISLDGVGAPLSGTCTFATAGGDPSVEVHFTGGDACAISGAPSPTPPPQGTPGGCPIPPP